MRLARRLGRLPKARSVRARLLALATVAAVPIVIIAGLLAQETFQETELAALGPAYLLQGQAIARYRTATARVQATLATARPVVEHSADCAATLLSEQARMPQPFVAIARFDAQGGRLCGVGGLSLPPGAPLPAWFTQVQGGAALVLGRTADGLPLAAAPAENGGVLAAELPPRWYSNEVLPDMLEPGGAVWLMDDTPSVIASRGATGNNLPTLKTMATLRGAQRIAVLAASAHGTPYAYAATALPNGWRLVTAYRATREHRTALRLLSFRLAELALVVVAGLAAIVFGAETAFGRPLRQLSAAVMRWRAGGAFDPGSLAGAPNEVHDLARSFTEATTALQEREAQLMRAEANQKLLMLEVHHRVKNNLQIIASLLNLQASRIRVPEARAEFQAARDRVRALATLHRHLYAEGELHTINMRSFLMELCGQLFQAIGEKEGHRLRLSIEAPELRMTSDQAVPLALIVTEAVTNSIKYAFPGGRSGHISVRLNEHDGVLDLEIEDDGIGIPAGRVETESGTRDGIGLQLIRGFSRQLGASLEVEEGHGTRYAVRLSLRPTVVRTAMPAQEEAFSPIETVRNVLG